MSPEYADRQREINAVAPVAPDPRIGRRFRFRFWTHTHTMICRGTTKLDDDELLIFEGADGLALVRFEIATVRCEQWD